MENTVHVTLNLTRDQAKNLIEWLVSDDQFYFGNTITSFEVTHGVKIVCMHINNHELLNFSNQYKHVVIDNGYVSTKYNHICNGIEYSGIDYCLYRLGF